MGGLGEPRPGDQSEPAAEVLTEASPARLTREWPALLLLERGDRSRPAASIHAPHAGGDYCVHAYFSSTVTPSGIRLPSRLTS